MSDPSIQALKVFPCSDQSIACWHHRRRRASTGTGLGQGTARPQAIAASFTAARLQTTALGPRCRRRCRRRASRGGRQASGTKASPAQLRQNQQDDAGRPPARSGPIPIPLQTLDRATDWRRFGVWHATRNANWTSEVKRTPEATICLRITTAPPDVDWVPGLAGQQISCPKGRMLGTLLCP